MILPLSPNKLPEEYCLYFLKMCGIRWWILLIVTERMHKNMLGRIHRSGSLLRASLSLSLEEGQRWIWEYVYCHGVIILNYKCLDMVFHTCVTLAACCSHLVCCGWWTNFIACGLVIHKQKGRMWQQVKKHAWSSAFINDLFGWVF